MIIISGDIIINMETADSNRSHGTAHSSDSFVDRQKALIIIIFFTTLSIGFCGGYSEETHTSFKAGPGFRSGDTVYFLLKYKLYKRSERIYSFPDGGQGKVISLGFYIMKYSNNRLRTIEKVESLTERDANMYRYTGEIEKNTLYFRMPGDILIRIDEVQSDDIAIESMTFTNNLIRNSYPVEAGLPSPLESARKRRKKYIDDLKKLKGDYFYRKEVIRQIGLKDIEIDNIIVALDTIDRSMTAKDLVVFLNQLSRSN